MAFKITREGNYFVILNTDNDQLDKYPGQLHIDISDSNQDANTTYKLRWYANGSNVVVAQGTYSDFLDIDNNPYTSGSNLESFIDQNASFTPSGGQNPLEIQYANYLPLFDAAGKMRVSSPSTLADLQQINDENPLLFDRGSDIGGATQVYSNSDGGTVMSVTTTGDKAIAQQNFFNHYFAGKSQDSLFTVIDFAPETNVIKRMGYFSSSTVSPFSANRDGIFLESSDQIYWIVEKNGVETLRVAQSDWNIDTMDGQDWDNFNVVTFDFLYLGGTGVLFYVFNGREKKPVHVFDHAGLFPSTILVSPSQPIRYEIESTGGAGSMIHVCAQAGTENAITEVGKNNSFAVFDFQANTAGNIYAVLGLRLKANRRNALILINELKIMAETNDDLNWILCLNPTITGPGITWGNADAWGTINDSNLEVAIGAGGAAGGANIITDVGTRIASGGFNGNTFASSLSKNDLKLGSLIDGTMTEVWWGCNPVSNGLDVFPHINVEEF